MLRLSEDSLEFAKKHLIAQSDGNIFPRPFEIDAIEYNWGELKKELCTKDILCWNCFPYRRCLTPKHLYGFRISTQIDPLDCLILTAILFEFGQDIESLRIPSSERVCFSHHFAPDASTGRLYDPDFDYQAFEDGTNEFLEDDSHDYIVITDIADFYPRIYLHPLENALAKVNHGNHANAVLKMIKHWNSNVSYGIPVGPRAVHLLAELLLNDVDRELMADDIKFCRYVDDYRIFASDYADAYSKLSDLANLLFEIAGLTLQPHKTQILTVEDFQKSLDRKQKSIIRRSRGKFLEILRSNGLRYDPYNPIRVEELSSKVKKQINKLDFSGRLVEQINSDEIDISLTRFLLDQLGRLRDAKPVRRLIDDIDGLYPVFADVMKYLERINFSKEGNGKIGEWLIDTVLESHLSHLDFHKLWIFNLLQDNGQRLPAARILTKLYDKYDVEFSRRELILAFGKTSRASWFAKQRRDWEGLRSWERRAFLYGSSCMAKDQRKHWYRSIRSSMTLLERAVCQWADNNPIA